MTERRIVIDQLKFSYEGLFNVEELYSTIVQWFYEKGWDWQEDMNQEQVTPQGKHIRIVLSPWKNLSDFHREEMKIKIVLSNVKEVDVEFEGKTLRMHQGLIKIIFDGYLKTDRKGWWSNNIFTWWATYIFDRLLMREHFEKAVAWVESDVQDVYEKIKVYLNSYNYTYRNLDVNRRIKEMP